MHISFHTHDPLHLYTHRILYTHVCVCVCVCVCACLCVCHDLLHITFCTHETLHHTWNSAHHLPHAWYPTFSHITLTYHLVPPTRNGVATVSRIDKIIGLFCKRAPQKRQYSAKETYNFIDPTNRSHTISPTLYSTFFTHCISTHYFHLYMSKETCMYMSKETCMCVKRDTCVGWCAPMKVVRGNEMLMCRRRCVNVLCAGSIKS